MPAFSDVESMIGCHARPHVAQRQRAIGQRSQHVELAHGGRRGLDARCFGDDLFANFDEQFVLKVHGAVLRAENLAFPLP